MCHKYQPLGESLLEGATIRNIEVIKPYVDTIDYESCYEVAGKFTITISTQDSYQTLQGHYHSKDITPILTESGLVVDPTRLLNSKLEGIETRVTKKNCWGKQYRTFFKVASGEWFQFTSSDLRIV